MLCLEFLRFERPSCPLAVASPSRTLFFCHRACTLSRRSRPLLWVPPCPSSFLPPWCLSCQHPGLFQQLAGEEGSFWSSQGGVTSCLSDGFALGCGLSRSSISPLSLTLTKLFLSNEFSGRLVGWAKIHFLVSAWKKKKKHFWENPPTLNDL